MLLVSYISENKQEVIQGLEKRFIENAAEIIDGVLALDEDRRRFQKERDDALADANKAAKEIGMLMKSGKRKPNKLKRPRLKTSKKQKIYPIRFLD